MGIRLCGYTPGKRATLEAHVCGLHFAVKAYTTDPASEASLYKALGAVGLAGETGPRVPRLLTWVPSLRLMAISWLEGTPVNLLLSCGRGQRAGELAADFLRRTVSVPVTLGPPLGRTELCAAMKRWVARLFAMNPTLGIHSAEVATSLHRTELEHSPTRLVHGSFYARHILDTGDGPGVIDWQRFGQGPLEVDAGMFLATISRIALRHEDVTAEAESAEKAFLALTRGLVDENALAWYRAAGLLRLSARRTKRRPLAELRRLVNEAARFAEFASAGGVVISYPVNGLDLVDTVTSGGLPDDTLLMILTIIFLLALGSYFLGELSGFSRGKRRNFMGQFYTKTALNDVSNWLGRHS